MFLLNRKEDIHRWTSWIENQRTGFGIIKLFKLHLYLSRRSLEKRNNQEK